MQAGEYNITIATEAEVRECDTEHEAEGDERYTIHWVYRVKPIRGTAVQQVLDEVGIEDTGYIDEHPTSPRVVRFMQEVAARRLTEIVAASRDGRPLKLNGKPVTAPGLRQLIIDAFFGLATAAAMEAIVLGQQLAGERGNSEPAPASQSSIPEPSPTSGSAT